MIHLKALLLGLALASPPLAALVLRTPPSSGSQANVVSVSHQEASEEATMRTQVQIEIRAKGSAPQWILVEAPVQSIPEPGVLPLATLAAALLLRRKRRKIRN